MSRRRIVIIGAGGHGRELLDLLRAAAPELDFLGFLDDGAPDLDRVARLGSVVLGPTSTMRELDAAVLLGVGDGSVRRTLAALVSDAGRTAIGFCHPTATVGADVHIGEGFVLFAHASVTTNVRIGRHVHVSTHAAIAHDCRIGDYVTINPAATISGNVTIDERATIGAGAVAVPGVSIGACSIVGAGAVVTRNVPAGVVAVGVPARVVRDVDATS